MDGYNFDESGSGITVVCIFNNFLYTVYSSYTLTNFDI